MLLHSHNRTHSNCLCFRLCLKERNKLPSQVLEHNLAYRTKGFFVFFSFEHSLHPIGNHSVVCQEVTSIGIETCVPNPTRITENTRHKLHDSKIEINSAVSENTPKHLQQAHTIPKQTLILQLDQTNSSGLLAKKVPQKVKS